MPVIAARCQLLLWGERGRKLTQHFGDWNPNAECCAHIFGFFKSSPSDSVVDH